MGQPRSTTLHPPTEPQHAHPFQFLPIDTLNPLHSLTFHPFRAVPVLRSEPRPPVN